MKNTHNPNRPRSSKNPKGKRNDSPINWTDCNKGRKPEGKYYVKWMVKVASKIHEIMAIPQGKISAAMVVSGEANDSPT